MANNFDSNFTRKVMRSFLDKFESERVLTKNVNTQLFNGQFNPSTGDTIDVKRPTQPCLADLVGSAEAAEDLFFAHLAILEDELGVAIFLTVHEARGAR